MDAIHVAIAPGILGEFFGIPLTNTLLTSWVVIFGLLAFTFILRRRIAMVPGKTQLLIEMTFAGIYDYIESTLESKDLARKLFPILVTIFVFVFLANIAEFIPGVGSLGFFSSEHGEEHFTPLLRSVNSDLNMTLALAVIAFFTIEVLGVMMLGFFKYTSKFLNFHSVGGFFLGLSELISEVMRLVSFSFRLFGNIFAGTVLIEVILFFAPYIVPIPFIGFELFVGLMQAAIFSLLTLFFVKIAITEMAH